ARCAVSALQAVLLEESFLKRMKLPVSLESFHGQHVTAVGLNRKHRTGLHRASIQNHRTSSAVAGVTTDVSSRQPERFADKVNKQQSRFNISLVINSVHSHADRSHHLCSSFRPARSNAYGSRG